MRRLPTALASLAALCVLMFGISACNLHLSPYAAIVNGYEISQSRLGDALSAVAKNAGYKCSIVSSGTSHVVGAGQGTYNAAFSAEVLSILIQDKVVRQEVARLKLPEPPSLGQVALSQLQGSSTPASGCAGSGASVVAAFPPWYRDVLLRFQEDEDALSAHLAGITLRPGSLDAYVAHHEAAMTLACVSVIEVGTRATALSVRSRILSGASFAAMAAAHSIDSTTATQGGVIGCIPDTEFNAPLNTVIAGLTVGRVSAPVAFSSNWLLLLVTQRQKEAYQQLISSLVSEELPALDNFFPRLFGSAKVEVDPQYGTWSTKGALARVEANAGPPARLVPNAGANAGPAA